jgi:hypothetical protein
MPTPTLLLLLLLLLLVPLPPPSAAAVLNCEEDDDEDSGPLSLPSVRGGRWRRLKGTILVSSPPPAAFCRWRCQLPAAFSFCPETAAVKAASCASMWFISASVSLVQRWRSTPEAKRAEASAGV